MMMPTLRMCSRRSGGDGTENFVEAAGLEVQLLEPEALAGGELGERRENGGPGLRQSREARVALAHFEVGHRRERRHRGARGGELRGVVELHRHGVVITRAGRE